MKSLNQDSVDPDSQQCVVLWPFLSDTPGQNIPSYKWWQWVWYPSVRQMGPNVHKKYRRGNTARILIFFLQFSVEFYSNYFAQGIGPSEPQTNFHDSLRLFLPQNWEAVSLTEEDPWVGNTRSCVQCRGCYSKTQPVFWPFKLKSCYVCTIQLGR